MKAWKIRQSMGSKLQNQNFHIDSSIEGVMLGGLAGGINLAYTLSYFVLFIVL